MQDAQLRSCQHCGAQNRVALRHLADAGRCGKCKQSLPPASVPIEITGVTEFDELLAQVRVPVVVDFWAPWCGPCRVAGPIVSDLARTLSGQCVVLKVNTDVLPPLAERYAVRGIPHFAVIKEGKTIAQQSGVMDAPSMRRWVASAVS